MFFGAPAVSQHLEWAAGFNGFLDNREYYSLEIPKTIFGSRAWGEIGGSLNDVHRIRFGMNYLYEFGHRADAHSPDIIMYYQYRNDWTDFRLGAFPRSNLLDFPMALLSDTLHYYRPNMEGVYWGHRGEWGYQNMFIDWTSRQTDEDHERFVFGFSGKLRKGFLFLSHYFLMGHFAGKSIPEPDFHLRDNGGFQVNLGSELSDKVFLDTLCISIGTLVSLDRIRGVDESWQTPAGFMGEFTAIYKRFGIHGLYYRGQGHTFLYGDPFYRLDKYGRVDLFYEPFGTDNVKLKINLALHYTETQIDYSQQILVSMALNGFRPFRNSGSD